MPIVSDFVDIECTIARRRGHPCRSRSKRLDGADRINHRYVEAAIESLFNEGFPLQPATRTADFWTPFRRPGIPAIITDRHKDIL
jgi:hypothetical protein